MVRRSLNTIGLILLLLLLSCCSREETPLPVIKIGHAPHDHHSPLYIAAMNPDYFRSNGGIYLKEITSKKKYLLVSHGKPLAEIIVHSSTGGKELIRKLDEDQLNLTFGGIVANLYFIDQGSPIKILAPVMAEGTGLVVSNNVPVNNWSEFVGYAKKRKDPMRIGYKIAFSQNLIFEHALKDEGVSYSNQQGGSETNIELINLYGAKNLLPALENDLIDGFVVNQPFLSLAHYKKAGRTIATFQELPPKDFWQNHPCCVLSSKKLFYQEHRELVQQLVTIFLRASQFITENPAKASAQIAEWLQLPIEVEQESIPTIKFVTEYDQGWNRGTNFIVRSLVENEKLNREIKKAFEDDKTIELIYNLELLENARRQM